MKKCYIGPQIVAKLRQADVLIGKGNGVLSLHKLRKFAGENWAKSVAPKTLQELMGHASINTTIEFYDKVTENDIQKAADAIVSLLSQSDDRR